MADLQTDDGTMTIYGWSTQRYAFRETIDEDVFPFVLTPDQVEDILDYRIDPDGTISYEIKELNTYLLNKPPTADCNFNGKRLVNIGTVPNLADLDSILATPNIGTNVTTMSTYVYFYNALNTLYAGPLFGTINMKGKRPYALADADLPAVTDTPEQLAEKNQGVLTTGYALENFPNFVAKIRDPFDTEQPNRPFFDMDQRVCQSALDPVVSYDLVTLGFMKQLTLNRGNLTEEDFDCANRQISSLLEPEEVKETMTELYKTTELARAINYKFLKDVAISRLGTVREDPPGTINFNTVFSAQNKIIADLANAKISKDALPLGQAESKFLAKDGESIDAGDKKIINGLEATDDYDFVVKKQLDDLDDELRDLIDNIGGSGNNLLDIISLIASLTSLATSLASLGLKAGTALTSIASAGAPLLNAVLALASVVKGPGGSVALSTAQKVANGLSLNDYAPDPENPQAWAEQQADLDRMRYGARDIESSAGQPPNSVGASWLNGLFESALSSQRQLLNAFELVV